MSKTFLIKLGPLWLDPPGKKPRGYVKALLFCDRRTMHAFHAEQVKVIRAGGNFANKYTKFEALAQNWGYSRSREHQTRVERGQVLLHCDYLGAGVVAHEMTHIAFMECHRRGLKPTMARGEERLCRLVGELCQQFWRKFYIARQKGLIRGSWRTA